MDSRCTQKSNHCMYLFVVVVDSVTLYQVREYGSKPVTSEGRHRFIGSLTLQG